MKVLVVDDDAMQRMLLADLIKGLAKVDIVEAADGDAAWQELRNGLYPVLCCCDIRMPRMSGIELLEHVKSRSTLADMPFIFVTAATDRTTIQQAIMSGATMYLLKPFDLPKVRPRLEKLFRVIGNRYREEPAATQERLGVSPERLLDYLAGLKQKVADWLKVAAASH